MNSSISTATPSLKLLPEQAASKHLMMPPGATIKGCALKAVFNACSKPANATGTHQHARDMSRARSLRSHNREWASGCHHETVGLRHLSLGDGGWRMRQRKLCSLIHHLSSNTPELATYVVPTPFPLCIISHRDPPSCISLGDHVDDAVLLCGFRLGRDFPGASSALSWRQPSHIHGTSLQDHRQRYREGGHARKPLSALCTRQQAQVHLASG